MAGITARCVAALSLVCLVACSNTTNSIPTSPIDAQTESQNMNPQLLSSSSELSFPQSTEPVTPDALNNTNPYALPTSPPSTKLNNTWGRTGLGQIFDSRISASQATTDAHRYDFVWGSTIPASWRAGNSKILAGLYYIMTDDNIS